MLCFLRNQLVKGCFENDLNLHMRRSPLPGTPVLRRGKMASELIFDDRAEIDDLLQSGVQFRLLAENVKDYAIFLLDPKGTIVSWNKGAEYIKGYEAEEIIGKHFSCFYPVEDVRLGKPERELETARREGRFEEEGLRIRKDGSQFWANVIITALLDEKNSLRGFSKITRDITERRQAEILLQRQAELLHLSYDAIIVWRPGGAIESWNKGAEELYGYSKEEAVGQVARDLLKTIHPEPWPLIEARLHEGKFWEGELKHRTREGREVIVSARIQLVRGEDGVERVLETNRDITKRKSAEEELLHLNQTLRALSNTNQAAMHAEDVSNFLDGVCRIIVEDCGHPMVWVGFAEDDENKTVRPVAQAGFEEGYLETIKITWSDTELGRGPTGTAIRTGTPDVCRNMLTEPRMRPWREQAIKRGYAFFRRASAEGRRANPGSTHDLFERAGLLFKRRGAIARRVS